MTSYDSTNIVISNECRFDSSMRISEIKKTYNVGDSLFRSMILGKKQRQLHAVDEISFLIKPCSIVAFVGESGCGKTTLGKMTALYEVPTSGTIDFENFQIPDMTASQKKQYRRKVQMIFQDPYDSLNPRFQIGQTCMEPLIVQNICDSKKEREDSAIEALQFSGLTPPREFFNRYPHELSGGQRQRVAIARATVLEPKFIVADEPVSMLDVSLRAGILRLFNKWRKESSVSIMFITHDLAVARYISDEIAVMYLGEIVESGTTEMIIARPLHPYTKGLLGAVPEPNPFIKRQRSKMQGDIPSPIDLPEGCRFFGRCPDRLTVCKESHPLLKEVEKSHTVRCHLYNNS